MTATKEQYIAFFTKDGSSRSDAIAAFAKYKTSDPNKLTFEEYLEY